MDNYKDPIRKQNWIAAQNLILLDLDKTEHVLSPAGRKSVLQNIKDAREKERGLIFSPR